MTDQPERLDAAALQAHARHVASNGSNGRGEMGRGESFVPESTFAEARQAQAKARRVMWEKAVPRKYRDAAPGDFPAKVAEQLTRWQAAATDGVNLVITGPLGTGKTRAAFAAAQQLHADGESFAFWPVESLKHALDWRNEGHLELTGGVSRVGVLILDDLGVGTASDWWLGKLYSIINERWLHDLPTIATTNLEPGELESATGDRTFSRIADGAVGVRLAGQDWRRGGSRT